MDSAPADALYSPIGISFGTRSVSTTLKLRHGPDGAQPRHGSGLAGGGTGAGALEYVVPNLGEVSGRVRHAWLAAARAVGGTVAAASTKPAKQLPRAAADPPDSPRQFNPSSA